MSLLRMGRNPDGTRAVVILEPAVGRKRGHGGISTGFLAGTYVVTESSNTQNLRRHREWLRKKRAEAK